VITFADISEFQEGAALPIYRAQHDVLIIRAHNGNRPDHLWPASRNDARKLNFTALGFYQYMVASRPADEQAHDFIKTVGAIRDNEFVICDSEEGVGSQISRVQVRRS
jgi:GH25 family lysozyme M1 (1,4-beta-N-acetylmuramidase)